MERGAFSGSEDFAKSLEPRYDEQQPMRPRPVHHRTVRPAPQESAPRRHEQREPSPVSPHHHHRRKKFEVFAALYLFFLLVMVFLLSMSTDTSPFAVLLGFLPTLFTVVIAMIIYEASKDNKNVLWVIPLVLVFGFYWVGKTQGGFVGTIDVDALTALNLLFCFLYLIINYFLLQSAVRKEPKSKVVVQERVVEKVVEKELIPDDLSKFIASIEDKSKALNFTIGRVYNAYHGGTKELRQKINMKQEWYDQFSQLPKDPAQVNFLELSALISTIESRLRLLEKSELEIFGSDHKRFKNLVRDRDGKDKIIDVLDKNDKDPVKSYVEGALQFCGKVKDFIRKRQSPEVKNEYVARPDEEKKAAPRSSSWTSDNKLRK